MAGNKTIYISDIHMGTARSEYPVDGKHPWGWLGQEHADRLARFLNGCMADPDIADVVILGDLFDDWVIPPDLDPKQADGYGDIFTAVANAPQNRMLMDAFRAVAGHPATRLHYVPGNHDMYLTEAALSGMIPDVVFHSDGGPGLGHYADEGVRAEHGSRLCLFNAPDGRSHPGGELPMGYFLARAVAGKVARTGKGESFLNILDKAIGRFQDEPDWADKVFKATMVDAGMWPDGEFVLGLDGFSATMTAGEAADMFSQIYEQWNPAEHEGVGAGTALRADGGLLGTAIDRAFYERHGVKVVICGHTHTALMNGRPPVVQPADTPAEPCRRIYANTGSWVDDKEARTTFVETEHDRDAGRLWVRLKWFRGNRVQTDEELFVTL